MASLSSEVPQMYTTSQCMGQTRHRDSELAAKFIINTKHLRKVSQKQFRTMERMRAKCSHSKRLTEKARQVELILIKAFDLISNGLE